MCDSKVNYVKKPVLVDELAVYFISPGIAQVAEIDCRVELITTQNSCTCCTYRFRSYGNPGFQCRHIKAVRKVLSESV